MASAVAMGSSAIGGLLTAAGSVAEGEAADTAARFNASQLEKSAVRVKEKAKEDERIFRTSVRKQRASNVAGVAASGIELTGSPLEVLMDNAVNAELDALNIRHAGEVQASNLRSEAAMTRIGGRAARQAGNIGAAAGALKTISSIAGGA